MWLNRTGGCYEMIYVDAHVASVSVSLELDPTCYQKRAGSHEECPAGPRAYSGSPVEYPQPRSRKSAKLVGFEDNTAWYGQEKKLWVNMSSLYLSPSIHPSLTHHRSFDSKKNKENYIFIKKCCSSSIHHEYIIGNVIGDPSSNLG